MREKRHNGIILTGGGYRWIRLDAEALPDIKDWQNVSVAIDTPRSLKQHRLFWGMLRFASDHSDQWSSPDEVLLWVKAELGLWHTIRLGDKRILQFESTSFRDMSGKKFKDLFDRSTKLLAEKMGLDPLQFTKEMGKDI